MNDRFTPKWNRLKRPMDDLIFAMSGIEYLLVESFVECSRVGVKSRTVDDVKRELRGIVMGPDVPWVFYDTITSLMRKLPIPTRKAIIDAVSIDTGHTFERLQPNRDGTWQVVWKLETEEDENEQPVALDWYTPPDFNKAPIVPIGIIDYVAGSISLLRSNLVLPSVAVLLIALESVLWDKLVQNGVSRLSEKIIYKSVQWDYKKMGGKLVFTISGTDKNLGGLDAAMGIYPAEGSFNLRKVGAENSRAILRVEVEEHLLGFFATESEEKRESFAEKGLSEAVQRARKADILKIIPVQLDETIVKLRNNLIHLAHSGLFDPSVPIPSGGQILSHDELRRDPQLVKDLIYMVVELINNLYATP